VVPARRAGRGGAVVLPLAAIAFARSGDKGDTSDLSLFAPDAATYDLLVREVTAERVAAHLTDLVTGTTVRYEVPNVLALKFVCAGALGGGGAASLRADNLGKSLGGALLRLPVVVDAALAERTLDRPSRDPYASSLWTV
jgi:hypothetical protein